jgi:hypothetical protein
MHWRIDIGPGLMQGAPRSLGEPAPAQQLLAADPAQIESPAGKETKDPISRGMLTKLFTKSVN